MALKLKVHWRTEPLEVDLSRVSEGNLDTVMREIRASGLPHVRTEGDDVIVENFFEKTNNVLDVSRYLIGEEDCCVHDDGRYRICNDRYLIRHCDIPESELQIQQQTGSIVLLLESPHEAEYTDDEGGYGIDRRQVPANGDSGENIDLCLGTVLLHIQIETGLVVSDRHVVISNPVQFQTSLHAIHGQSVSDSPWDTLRNNVWRALWGNENEHIQQCFLARLERYHPRVIINACTSDLKHRVTSSVEGWLNARGLEIPLYKIDHPANWQNLRPKRIYPPTNPNADNPQ